MATLFSARTRCIVCAALLGASASSGGAQEAAVDAALEVTIRLLPENAVGRPDEITRRIELPPAARPESPTDGAPPGARNGLGAGLDTATEARERGREFGQEIAEQARENRENAGRPDHAGPPSSPGPPADPPAPPGNVPGPPITPPGRP